MKKLMIGVSTEQNTTNILPASQNQVNDFMFIETSYAYSQKWAEGVSSVMKRHKIKTHNSILLEKNEDSRIDLIILKIKAYLKTIDFQQIIWNIGGGQKAQQMALWQIFTDRSRAGLSDVACYTNPVTEEIEYWEYKNEMLAYRSEKVFSKFNAIEILEIFGFSTNNTGVNIKNYTIDSKADKLWKNDEFRRFFYEVSILKEENSSTTIEKRDIFNYVKSNNKQLLSRINKTVLKLLPENLETFKKTFLINNLIPQIVSELNKEMSNNLAENFGGAIAPFVSDDPVFIESLLEGNTKNNFACTFESFKKITNYEKPANFFEALTFNFVKENYSESKFADCLFNVYLFNSRQISTTSTAEYDVLFATRGGKLLALDAKTFSFPKKDADARLMNLTRAGGRYIQFIPIIPFSTIDWDKSFYPQTLKTLIKRFYNQNDSIAVLSEESIINQKQTVSFNEDIFEIKSIYTLLK